LLKAVIFDIEGTLVDSVDLHARAWQEAFAHFDHQVEFSTVRSQIGKGGDPLLPVFLPKEEMARRGREIEEYRSKLYKQRYLPKVRGFPEVRHLIERVKGNGLQVVLASSAKSDELQTYKQIAGIEDLVDEETSADDAAKSKPHPDIFKAALDRLGATASEAIVVGDSPYDAQAAGKIGLRTIGVLCGGFPEADLRNAGCIAIYRDPADLLRRFDPSVLARRVAPHRKIYPAMLSVGLTVAAVIALVIYRRRG
jgi:HAD superfamily hydrolase (TIGR01509 family)